jgi:hypothetical protein
VRIVAHVASAHVRIVPGVRSEPNTQGIARTIAASGRRDFWQPTSGHHFLAVKTRRKRGLVMPYHVLPGTGVRWGVGATAPPGNRKFCDLPESHFFAVTGDVERGIYR